MGSQQSRPEASLLSTAAGHDLSQATQCEVYSQTHMPGSLGPSTVTAMIPVTSSPDIRPSGAFPTDLPERPPKPSRLSLRKKKFTIPTPPLPNPMSLPSLPSPPLSPQSSASTIFTQTTHPYQHCQHEETLATPPSSPLSPRRFGRFSRKPFRLDGTSHLLKPATSTPSLATTLNQGDSSWTQHHIAPQYNLRPSLSPLSSAEDTPQSSSSGKAYDPLAQRFAQLRLSYSSSASSSGPRTDYFTQDLYQKPYTDQSSMGPSRHTSKLAPREGISPYQVKPTAQPSNRAVRARKAPGRRVPRPGEDDDVVYPDLSQRVARASSWSPLFEPESRSSTAEKRAVSAAQEEADRDFALQLQNEGDGRLFDIDSRSRRRREPRKMSRSSSPSDDDLLSDWKPWVAPQPNDVRLRRKPLGSATRGTREDPINLDSDDEIMHDTDSAYARQLQDEEIANRFDQEETDAEYALRLQREEEGERQRQFETSAMRDCAVCGDSFPIRDLPALVNCTHEPQTCATCYRTWIETELDAKSWNSISCPWSECQNVLQHYEVQQYATLEIYERFDKLSARSALNDDPNFYNCMAPNCNSGQFHYVDEQGPIFRCIECDFQFCTVHRNTWHEGETCEEYDYRMSGQKDLDQRRQEEASEKAIKQLAKKCPGKHCNYHIEKNDGCDHMTCRKCKHEFCWECLAPYKAIRTRGNAAHNRECRYHSDNIS